ncbi:MAG: ATP-dependent zinc metalloprotease FtsH [Megasphaera sp.]|jgi:cell division protease FtsH|nr:ATP-dependent zinc metalloprotease FtsH [Megasphaera sp.]MCH4187623.1 ATP-dependent zinc metalloprotease FtsH [Megasphaera sp.]MCH4217181.1 ATP-dependent zinc metalloprotease FtsH [Megasphaera sp.]
MDNKNAPKKPTLYYYGIVFIMIIVLNMVISPMFFQPKVHEVSYTNFLKMIDNGQAEKVEINDNKIAISCKEDDKDVIYVTGRVEDPELVKRLTEKNIEFSQVMPKEESALTKLFNDWILPIFIFFIIWELLAHFLAPRMGGGVGRNAMTFGKSNAKIYVKSQSGKTFADVAGQDEAKDALMELVNFLHDPSKYKNIGATMPKGALLVGPPGTGKTLLAEAVAGEAHVPFFSISGSEFIEMFVGMGAARVRDLFKQAKEKAPCIVFIDEIDAIGKKRDSGQFGSNDEREQTLNQLLAEMDGFDGSKGVIILAATNRPEVLDKALLRPGRFDRRIPVELPDLRGREAILKVHSRHIKMESPIDFNAIALSTSGASGADLANIVNEAALRAVRMDHDAVSQSDLEESVEAVIAGAQRKGVVISANEKRIIAFHEIGHALVAARQKNSAPVHKITIIPRTSGALGYTMQVAEKETFLMSREELFNKIVTFTGGRSAEELIFHSITTGASNDIEQATKLARAMVTRYGMSDEFDMTALETVNNAYLGGDASLACSAETATKIDADVMDIIKNAHAKAKKILEENEDKLHALAEYLVKKETITGDEFMEILNRSDHAGAGDLKIAEPATDIANKG